MSDDSEIAMIPTLGFTGRATGRAMPAPNRA
jgi:hypothetical protein